MHLKQSICYRKIRLILAKFCCNKQLSKNYKNISAPVEMYIFGMVIGTGYVFGSTIDRYNSCRFSTPTRTCKFRFSIADLGSFRLRVSIFHICVDDNRIDALRLREI